MEKYMKLNIKSDNEIILLLSNLTNLSTETIDIFAIPVWSMKKRSKTNNGALQTEISLNRLRFWRGQTD